ncbi:MAG: hypothetical protein ACE5FH_10620, partial [Candidatus Zixiibacteriota bacterium]
MRKSIIVSCLGLLVLGLWTTRATERHDITPLNNTVVTQPTQASRAGAFCTLKHHNDTAAGFYSGYDNGIRTVSYFDPSSCGSPTYPFEIQSFSFTLFDDGGYQWPVLVDIVIFDISADNDSCSGPGAELCRTTVSCDSVTFAFPNVGTVSLATPCCVNGPFFFGIEYAGNDMGLGPLPSVVFDNQPTVAACFNWVYSLDSTWYEWNDFWSPPVPGYPMFWVEGETEGAFCSSAEPIIYTPEGLHDNYEGLLGERVSVIGYYTGAGDNMLVSDLGEYLKDEPMSAKSEVMLRGDTLTDTLDLAFITATGYLQAEADPLSIYPDDTVTIRLYLHSVEKILDPKPVPSPPGEGYLDNGYDLSVPSAVCDSCKFAILISGGVNEANNHDRYWNNLDMLYNHKIDNEGYCAENIKVLYYNGVSENTAEIPQANVDSCTIAKVEAAHNDIAQRIAACNRAGKKSTLQKLITNHGAPGGINMLGNEVLDGGTFRSYQQKCIDSCCAFLFDEMVQCYGGNVADSLRSIDDKGKTEIKVNSGAGNVLHWSTAEDALFLRVKLDSLAAGRTYDEAVAAAAEEYGKYLDSLAARYRRWITEDSLWLAAHPPTGGPGDTVRNRVRRDTSRWRGYSNGITAGRDSTQGRSNIWVRLQMKRFCNWKSVVVPAGGQFCLEFKGDSTHCGNVTVYKDSVSGIHVLRTKVAVWNWNIPGSAGYVDGNNPRYLNGDSAKATTFWIHNDDGEYSITVTLRTDQPDAESASNENAFAGWSMGGTDSLST